MTWPRALLLAAASLAALHLACLLCGFRPMVAVLSGGVPEGSPPARSALLFGVAYAASHLACVVAAPIFAFAGVLGVALRRRL